MGKDNEIRPKGDRALQLFYLVRAKEYFGDTYNKKTPSSELKAAALHCKAQGLIYQNPRSEDLISQKLVF